MSKFVYEPEGIDIAIKELERAKVDLKEAGSELEKAIGAISDDSSFSGDSKKTIKAFLTMLRKYHKDLVDKDLIPEAVKAIGKIEEHIGDVKEWSAWREINGI